MLREEAVKSDKVFECRRLKKAVPLAQPRCLDPGAYCKHRTGCPLHILEKEAKREAG